MSGMSPSPAMNTTGILPPKRSKHKAAGCFSAVVACHHWLNAGHHPSLEAKNMMESPLLATVEERRLSGSP